MNRNFSLPHLAAKSLIPFLIIFNLMPTPGSGVTQTAVLFLLISPSPRAAGMGNTYTTLEADDPYATFYNPAALGCWSREHVVSGVFYTDNLQWLPSLVSGMEYSYNTFAVGFNLKDRANAPLSLGLAFNRTYLDLGEQVYTAEHTDEHGHPVVLGTVHSWDKAMGFTAGFCLDYPIRISGGISFKHIISHLFPVESGINEGKGKASANAWDIGVIVHCPIFDFIREKTRRPLNLAPGIKPFFIPTFSYAMSNIGGKITYISEAQADPLPREARVGVGFNGGIALTKESLHWKLLSLRWAREARDILVDRENGVDWKYKIGFGEINVFEDIFFNTIQPVAECIWADQLKLFII